RPGTARIRLRVLSRVGLATGVGLLVFGTAPVTAPLGIGLTAASAVLGLRTWWTPRRWATPKQPRAPTARVLVRAAVRFIGPLGLAAGLGAAVTASGPVGVAVGLTASAGWLWAWKSSWHIRLRKDGKRQDVVVEHRVYTTGVQTLLRQVPVLGKVLEWLGFTQLLHFKKWTEASRKAWRDEKNAWLAAKRAGSVPGGLRGRLRGIRAWGARAWAFVGRLKYNRAGTATGPVPHEKAAPWVGLAPVFGPEFGHGFFGIGLKTSAGNLGLTTVLDTPPLDHNSDQTRKNRIFGIFPVVRLSLQFYVGIFRIDFFLIHFDVPGKKLEQKFDTPKLVGWRRFNLPLRFWHWVRVHDLKPFNGKPWNFISQTQFGIGWGPRPAPHAPVQASNFFEYRGSLQKLSYSENGTDRETIDMVNGVGPMVGQKLAQLAPRWLRALAAGLQRNLTARQQPYHTRLRDRGLAQLRHTVHRQLERRDDVHRKIERTEDRIRALAARTRDPLTAAGTLSRGIGLRLRLAHLRRRHAQLLAALNDNTHRINAYGDFSGSPSQVLDPPAP
ncbi:hypothetical protein, partial [Pseudonocardia acaciae]|uniref:hypothetical protein n=1 Tax=Pseudonocardia acaciae TaxID=551276 RepID=UPI000566B3B0